MKTWLWIFPLLLAAAVAGADETFPDTGWRDRPNPLADPGAQVGGEIAVYLGQYPRSLNYYLDGSTQSAQVFGALYESLLDMDPVSAEYRPGLAERWTISADKRTFTFQIDPAARWSDGRAVTAQDVRFTYDTIAYSDDVLQELVDLVGADRIMVGSDYCFDIAYEEPVKMIREMKTLNEEQKQLILGDNAKRLLRL